MASFGFTPAKLAIATGALDLGTVPLYALLVMTNDTLDVEPNCEFIGDVLGTFDENDYAGATPYERKKLTTPAVTSDLVNFWAELAADPIEWEDLGAATRLNKAMVIYVDANDDGLPADDATNLLVAYIDTGGFPFDGNGSDVIVAWNAEGILQLK